MSDTVTVNIKGLKELAEALKQMPERIAGKALGASVAAGAAIIRDQARANAPVASGATKKSIVAYRKRGSHPDNIGYRVGVTLKKKWPGRGKGKTGKGEPAYWWIFNEFGTSKQAAKPFMRPAFDQQGGRALAAIKMMLEKAVVIAAAACPKYGGR